MSEDQTVPVWLVGLDESKSDRPRIDAVKGLTAGLRLLGRAGTSAGAIELVEAFFESKAPVVIGEAPDEETAQAAMAVIEKDSGGVCAVSLIAEVEAAAIEADEVEIYLPQIVYVLLTITDGNPLAALSGAVAFAQAGIEIFEDVKDEIIHSFRLDKAGRL